MRDPEFALEKRSIQILTDPYKSILVSGILPPYRSAGHYPLPYFGRSTEVRGPLSDERASEARNDGRIDGWMVGLTHFD